MVGNGNGNIDVTIAQHRPLGSFTETIRFFKLKRMIAIGLMQQNLRHEQVHPFIRGDSREKIHVQFTVAERNAELQRFLQTRRGRLIGLARHAA